MFKLLKNRNGGQKEALREIIGDHELPSFPSAVTRALRAIRDPDASLREIGRTLEIDPGLVVRVLRTVNSAAFGLSRCVETVDHAAGLLGRAQLESLVLAVAIKGILPASPNRCFRADLFWRAAARRATLGRELAAQLHPATQAETFTAAFLQDMAIPVLIATHAREYEPLLDEWHASKDVALNALETRVFGWDHPTVGSMMASFWNLPAYLSDAILEHHGDGEEGSTCEPAVRLVALLRETDDATGVDELVETARSAFGLDPDAVVSSVDRAFEQAHELAQLLN